MDKKQILNEMEKIKNKITYIWSKIDSKDQDKTAYFEEFRR